MVLLHPNHPQNGPPLNAISPIPTDLAQRRAGRIALCQRLAELGMELAEAAQREALRDLQPRPERSTPPSGQWMPTPPPHFRDTRAAELFATLSRCVRQAILLQARLDSGAYDRPPPARTSPPDAATKSSPQPNRPSDNTYLDHERLEDDLAIEATRAPDDILTEIGEQLGQIAKTSSRAQHPARSNTPPQKPESRPRRTIRERPPPKPTGPQPEA